MGSLKPLIEPATAESIVAKKGTTTTNGAGDGSTVVDTGLTEANDYWNDMTLLILSGASDGQSRDITDFAGGTLTVSPVFANQILSGVRYLILPIKPSAAEVEDLKGTGFIKDTDSLVDLSHEAGAKGTDNISDHLGYEGATSLATKLTLARAGYLDNINQVGLLQITAARAVYLDNINNANLATIADISSLTATEIGYLAELAAANIPSDVDDILADTGELQTDWANGGRLDLLIDAIKAKTDNLAGETPSESSTTKNWDTVNDSPDGAGGIVTTIGGAATRMKVLSLLLDVNALTATAAIDVKLFIKINGTSRKVYDESFVVGTDPDGLWVINGTLGIHDILTIVVDSDTDESVAIGYTIMTEAM